MKKENNFQGIKRFHKILIAVVAAITCYSHSANALTQITSFSGTLPYNDGTGAQNTVYRTYTPGSDQNGLLYKLEVSGGGIGDSINVLITSPGYGGIFSSAKDGSVSWTYLGSYQAGTIYGYAISISNQYGSPVSSMSYNLTVYATPSTPDSFSGVLGPGAGSGLAMDFPSFSNYNFDLTGSNGNVSISCSPYCMSMASLPPGIHESFSTIGRKSISISNPSSTASVNWNLRISNSARDITTYPIVIEGKGSGGGSVSFKAPADADASVSKLEVIGGNTNDSIGIGHWCCNYNTFIRAYKGETVWANSIGMVKDTVYSLPITSGNPNASYKLTIYTVKTVPAEFSGDMAAGANQKSSYFYVDFPEDANYDFDVSGASGNFNLSIDSGFYGTTLVPGKYERFVTAGRHSVTISNLYDNSNVAWSRLIWDIKISKSSTDITQYPIVIEGKGAGNNISFKAPAPADGTVAKLEVVGGSSGDNASATSWWCCNSYFITAKTGEVVWANGGTLSQDSVNSLYITNSNPNASYKLTIYPVKTVPAEFSGVLASGSNQKSTFFYVNFPEDANYDFDVSGISGKFNISLDSGFYENSLVPGKYERFVTAGRHSVTISNLYDTSNVEWSGLTWDIKISKSSTDITKYPIVIEGKGSSGTEYFKAPAAADGTVSALEVIGGNNDDSVSVTSWWCCNNYFITAKTGEIVWASSGTLSKDSVNAVYTTSSNPNASYKLTIYPVKTVPFFASGKFILGSTNSSSLLVNFPQAGEYVFDTTGSSGDVRISVTGLWGQVYSPGRNTLTMAQGNQSITIDNPNPLVPLNWNLLITTNGDNNYILNSSFAGSEWFMFSLPLEPANSSPASLGINTSNLYHWDPSVASDPTYSKYVRPQTMQAGYGYWAYLPYASTINLVGSANTSAKQISLSQGWNQIGDPFNSQIKLENVKVSAGGATYSLGDSQALPYVSDTMFGYRDGGYYQNRPYANSMAPWEGYFINAYQSCTLIIDPSSSSSRATAGLPRRAADMDWEMKVSATMGRLKDPDNYIGVSRIASDVFDYLDEEEPPHMNGFLSLQFDNQTRAGVAGKLANDIRSASQGEKKWTFSVKTDTTAQSAAISWSSTISVPKNLKMVLKDEDTGATVDMLQANSYQYTQDKAEKHFSITARQAESTDSGILKILSLKTAPSPVKSSVDHKIRFTYDVSGSPTSIIIEVKNMMGEKVVDIIGELSGSTEWDISSLGLKGVYIYKLTASTGATSQTSTGKLVITN